MVKTFKTKLIPSITFVFKYRWDKNNRGIYKYMDGWNKKELGIWYRKDRVVGKPKTGMAVNEIFTESNHKNKHTVGIELVIYKIWISFTFGETLKIKL